MSLCFITVAYPPIFRREKGNSGEKKEMFSKNIPISFDLIIALMPHPLFHSMLYQVCSELQEVTIEMK